MSIMKKSGAIVLFAGLAILVGCRASVDPDELPMGDPGAGTDPTAVLETTFATPSPTLPPVNEPRDDKTTLEFVVEGMSESVTVALKSGDLSTLGGPEFSLYMDEGRYKTAVTEEGRYRYAPGGEYLGDTYLEVGFIRNAQAEDSAPAYLNNNFADLKDTGDMGEIPFGDYYTAYYVYGYTDTSEDGTYLSYDAYFLQTDGGVVTVIISAGSEGAEGAAMRLNTLAKTLRIE